MRILVPSLLLVLAGCGRSLEEGFYRFEAVSLVQDSCHSGAPVPGPLPLAELGVSGDAVRIDFDAAGPLIPGVTGARGRNALIGRFLQDREVERFIADATFDVVQEILGRSCITFAHTSLVGRILSPHSFEGTLRIDYTRRPQAQPECIASCVVEMEYRATLTE